MRARTVNEAQNFQRGQSPRSSMGVGLEGLAQKYYDGMVREKELAELLSNDELLLYLFEDIYHKWKNKEEIKPEEVEVWSTTTSGDTPIIKISAPGVRETTLLRIEAFPRIIVDDIEKFLNGKEMKEKLSRRFSENLSSLDELTGILYNSRKKRRVDFGGWSYAEKVAERLEELLG